MQKGMRMRTRDAIMDFTMENGIISNLFQNSVKLCDMRPMKNNVKIRN